MSRKNYGDGSIFPRKDGRWVATATIQGKRKAFYGKDKKEAREKREEARRAVARGEYVASSKQKTGDYLEYWLEVHGSSTEVSSAQMYAYNLRKNIIPAIGHIPLQKLAPHHIQKVFSDFQGRLAPTTQHLLYGILNTALEDAVKWERIPKNPAKYITLPKPEKVRETTILSADQARLLVARAQETEGQIGVLILLLISTAIRINEALCLHWQSIDFEKGIIHVEANRAYDRTRHCFYEKRPKSKSSIRHLPLPKIGAGALSAHRLNQIERQLEASVWEDKTLVFTNPTGSYWWDTTAREQLARFLKDIGLPVLRPHELRHNVSTALLASGTPPKAVQALLGHSRVSTTMEIYGHVTPEMREDTADDIDRLFGSK